MARNSLLDRLRRIWHREQVYEPLQDGSAEESDASRQHLGGSGFSYFEYSIFLLLGVSMLWAWNMFLAAGPYFQERLRNGAWIRENFQAAETSLSTGTNLISVLILTRMQKNASYPKRIITSLVISTITFSILALRTKVFVDDSAAAYFAFLMLMVFMSSFATGLSQNGIFAFAAAFAEPAYMQGIMTGQAIAGVLPSVAQIVLVLSLQKGNQHHDSPPDDRSGSTSDPPTVGSSAALAYFLTATGISLSTLLVFFRLLARIPRSKRVEDSTSEGVADEVDSRKSVPLLVLFRKLFWVASGVFVTFAISMVFPVFTQQIVSVRPSEDQPGLLQPASFIPLAFLFWNSGDLLGRLMIAIPSLTLVRRPKIVLLLAFTRIVFVALYELCNVKGRGAVIKSDIFYLVVVQLCFGLTNGFLGSTCMVATSQYVDEEEREAAGSFMGLCLVAGLATGSLASFLFTGS